MKIGFDARFAVHDRRGIGTHVLNVIVNLALIDKVNQYILYIDKEDKRTVLPRQTNFCIKLIGPSNYLLWEQISLPVSVMKDKIDILHCTGNTAPIFLTRKTKLVITIHDVMYLKSYSEIPRSPILYQRMGRLYRKLIVPRAAMHAVKVMAVSKYSIHDIKNSIPALKEKDMAVTYNATSEVFGRQIGSAVDTIREKYAIRDGYVLAVGGTDPRKNTAFVIGNYMKLRREGKVAEKLVVVGVANWRRSQFYGQVQKANRTGDVLFMDFITEEELAALYHGARAVLYLSLYEGFGIPSLEAMTCGVPVITSNTTSMPEIVGDAALMIDPTDEKAFEVALIGLLNDENLRKELIKRGLERAKSFSWKKTAENTLKIYESVMR